VDNGAEVQQSKESESTASDSQELNKSLQSANTQITSSAFGQRPSLGFSNP